MRLFRRSVVVLLVGLAVVAGMWGLKHVGPLNDFFSHGDRPGFDDRPRDLGGNEQPPGTDRPRRDDRRGPGGGDRRRGSRRWPSFDPIGPISALAKMAPFVVVVVGIDTYRRKRRPVYRRPSPPTP